MSSNNPIKPSLTFLNHSSFLIESENSVLVVDPWLEGSAFNGGWHLLDSTTSNDYLITYLNSLEKNIFIWYSHEHSDHFAVPFVKQVVKIPNLNFIFQKTLDKRVSNFLKSQSSVIEASAGTKINLDKELKITTWPHTDGDSYCLIQIQDFNVLNFNDCVVRNKKEVERVFQNIRSETENIDFLFTQFGYANWIGNEEEGYLRQSTAEEIFRRMLLQITQFNPKYIIPFASYIYFSNIENFYLNDHQNTPKSLRNSEILQPVNDKIFFFKPKDKIFLSKSGLQKQLELKTPIAEQHWNYLSQNCKPVKLEEKNVDFEILTETFNIFSKKLSLNFLFLPQILQLLGFINPLNILLKDLNKIFRCSYLSRVKIRDENTNWDVELSSENLLFLLKNDYGYNTTHVSGRFKINPKSSIYKFIAFFIMQDYKKNGFFWASPLKNIEMFSTLFKIRMIMLTALVKKFF